MTCPSCGHRLREDDRYCAHCGEPLERRVPEELEARATPESPELLRRLEALAQRLDALEARLPRTRLLDRHLLPRAFAVLGHNALAGLLVSIPFLLLLGLLVAIVVAAGGVDQLRV